MTLVGMALGKWLRLDVFITVELPWLNTGLTRRRDIGVDTHRCSVSLELPCTTSWFCQLEHQYHKWPLSLGPLELWAKVNVFYKVTQLQLLHYSKEIWAHTCFKWFGLKHVLVLLLFKYLPCKSQAKREWIMKISNTQDLLYEEWYGLEHNQGSVTHS